MKTEIVVALIGVGGVILGSVISYQLTERQHVDQDLHARRVEATIRVREMIKAIAVGLERMALLNDMGQYERRDIAYKDIVRQKHLELGEYYGSNKPWLTEEVKRVVEASIDDAYGFSAGWQSLFLERFKETPYNIHPPSFFGYHDQADAAMRRETEDFRIHLDEFDKRASSVLGTQRPWWQRIFGN